MIRSTLFLVILQASGFRLFGRDQGDCFPDAMKCFEAITGGRATKEATCRSVVNSNFITLHAICFKYNCVININVTVRGKSKLNAPGECTKGPVILGCFIFDYFILVFFKIAIFIFSILLILIIWDFKEGK